MKTTADQSGSEGAKPGQPSVRERMLQATASFHATLLKGNDWMTAAQSVFPMVGEVVQVHRVYYFDVVVHPYNGEKFCSQRLEWNAGEALPQIDNPALQMVPFSLVYPFMEPLERGEPYSAVVGSIDHLPLREVLMAQSIVSILVMPLFIGGKFYGFLGFDDCIRERNWRQDEVQFLEVLCTSLAAAIEKQNHLQTIQTQEEQFRHLVNNLPGIAYRAIGDEQLSLVYASVDVQSFLGYSTTDSYSIEGSTTLGTTNKRVGLAQFVHPEDFKVLSDRWSVPANGVSFQQEYRLIASDGRVIWVADHGTLLTSAEFPQGYIDGILFDITAKKEQERKMLAQEAEMVELQQKARQERERKQKAMARYGLYAQEIEREKIAAELHDNVNQLLATTSLCLEHGLLNPEVAPEMLSKSRGIVVDVIHEIRQLSRRLVAPSWQFQSLENALRELVNNMFVASSEIVQVQIGEDVEQIPNELKLTIYRIAQEQIHNIRKYAQASDVNITAFVKEKNLVFRIADNGVGFQPNAAGKGVGLKSISNRVFTFEGMVELISSPNAGCVLSIQFPLNTQSKNA